MNAHRFLPVALLVASSTAAGLHAAPAGAAESYDACVGTIASLPVTVSTQGTWCLKSDLSTAIASGVAIDIQANNVTLDCNGFKLGGLAAGLSTATVGVQSTKLNSVVRNCNIRGFATGVDASGTGALVEDNRFEGNTATAISVGSGSVVRRNLVLDTGGSPNNFVYAVIATGTTEVSDNRVDGTLPGYNGGLTRGIYGANAEGLVIRDNIIVGIAGGTSSPVPLSVQSGSRATIAGNFVSIPTTTSVGIGCPTGAYTIVRENTVLGPTTEDPDCVDFGNNWFN